MDSHQKALAAAIAASLSLAVESQAATITVDSASDNPMELAVGQCRLRAAVAAANSDSPQFGCAAGNGADTIVFDSSLTRQTITLQQGQITVQSDITIDGNSASAVTISGDGNSRIFDVDGPGGGDLTVDRLTLADGSAPSGGGAIRSSGMLTVLNSTLTGNTAVLGGAIYSNNTLTIANSTLTDNRATGDGGALYLQYSAAIDDSEFENNVAEGDGGAIATDDVQLEIESTAFANNEAGTKGGAISGNGLGEITLTDSTLTSNTAGLVGAGLGGAIGIDGQSLTISHSLLTENRAETGGAGAIAFADTANETADLEITQSTISGNAPGAIATYRPAVIRETTISGNTGGFATVLADGSALVVLENSTLSSNSSVFDEGGAIRGYAFELVNSTLVANAPFGVAYVQSLEIRNTVVADSVEGDCLGSVTNILSNVNNFVGDGTCAEAAVNLMSGSAALGPLQNNGGLTLTHAPLPGSPLVEAGDAAECLLSDQTGLPRPVDGDSDGAPDCDIGAVEFVDLYGPTAALDPVPDVTLAGANSLALVVVYTEADATVDIASLGAEDLLVTPGPLSVAEVEVGGSAESRVVTYRVVPPGGVWDGADSGEYQVVLKDNEVFDTATTGANAAAGGLLGTFDVAIAEIAVQGNGVSITSGDTTPSASDDTAFGGVALGDDRTAVFTIRNEAAGTLNLTQPVVVSGSQFSVSQPATLSLGAGASTTFAVTFAPDTVGPSAATVTIANDDADEGPFTFAVSGTGTDGSIDLIFADGFD